jgi:signal peptidase II
MENKHLTFWGVAIFVFILDRISKLLVINNIPLNSSIDLGFFSLTHITNTGTLFGLAKGVPWFFILFAAAVSVYILVKYTSFQKKYQPILGLILAGAMGNLVDRLLYGAVIDFVDFHFWPAFNVADSAISVAIIALLILEYWPRKRNI